MNLALIVLRWLCVAFTRSCLTTPLPLITLLRLTEVSSGGLLTLLSWIARLLFVCCVRHLLLLFFFTLFFKLPTPTLKRYPPLLHGFNDTILRAKEHVGICDALPALKVLQQFLPHVVTAQQMLVTYHSVHNSINRKAFGTTHVNWIKPPPTPCTGDPDNHPYTAYSGYDQGQRFPLMSVINISQTTWYGDV